MKFFTCDEDGMVAINALNSDYVNNTAAVSKIIEAGTSADGNGYLYPDAGQNFMEFFLPLADGLDASMVTADPFPYGYSDQGLCYRRKRP